MTRPAWRGLFYPGLLLFAFTLPLSKSAATVLLVALYALAAAGLLRSRQLRADVGRSCRQPLTAALTLFSLVAYAGILYTVQPADGFAVANKFVTLPVIYLLVSAYLQIEADEAARTRKAESLLFSFLAGLTMLNLFGVAKFLGAVVGGQAALPLAPLGMHHIWYANVNGLGIYAAVSFLLFTRHGAAPRARLSLRLFVLLSALCILLSTSRTAWFGLALTAAITGPFVVRRKKRLLFFWLLSLLAFALAYQFIPFVHERLDLVAEDYVLFASGNRAGSSLGARVSMWQPAWEMFKMYPYLGIGTGDYYGAMRELSRVGVVPDALLAFNQPHNIYVFALATNGIMGLTALLYIFYRAVRHAAAHLRTDGTGRFCAFLALATAVHFMAAGFMDSLFNIQVLRYAFAFIMGVCIRDSVNRSRRP